MSENKRTYVKPDFTMMYFSANEAFADCNSVLDSSVTSYTAQSLSCLVSGNLETVFSSSTSGCGSNAVSTGTVVAYTNGTTYFLWYDDSVTGGNNPNTTLLDAVCAYAGVTQYKTDGSGQLSYSGWHIAIPTATITNYYTKS